MARLRQLCVWIVAIAVLCASPLASLGECLRCPPDCPMHLRAAPAPDEAAAHGDHAAHAGQAAHHAAHGVAHAEHGVAHADPGPSRQGGSGGAKRCHDAPDGAPVRAPEPADGPCIGGTCGHMDFSLARVIPDGVLSCPGALAPVLIPGTAAAAPDACHPVLPSAPPTEPPRPLLA